MNVKVAYSVENGHLLLAMSRDSRDYSQWLQNGMELQIFVHGSARPVIESFDYKNADNISIVLKAFLRVTTGVEDISYIAKKIGNKGCFELIKDNSAVDYQKDDFITYVFRLSSLKNVILHFDVIGHGECSYGCAMFENSYGKVKVPLRSKNNEVIGLMNFDYLIITPWENGVRWRVEEIDVPRWNPLCGKSALRSLEMGHRGCGSTNGQVWSVDTPIENTIASFELAFEKGADFVELDVHLSKDLQPIVFHDFHVAVKVKERSVGERKLLIPISELAYEEMSNTKLLLSNDKLDKYGEDFLQGRMSLFPSLEKVIKDSPSELGMFIEVKFPMQDVNGVWEADFLPNKDKLVERTLDIVYTHARQRRIIFGSFDPDICVMIKLKQPHYPVVFITAGNNETWPLLMDLRCRNFEMAVGFAKGAGFEGISVYADPLKQRMKEFSSYVKNNGLELFTWGDVNTEKAFLAFQRSIHVTGIIYDRLHQLK